MFEVLGFTEKEIQDRFGFMIEAFSMVHHPMEDLPWTDRLVMLMTNADTIRDVQPFKDWSARCPLTEALAVLPRNSWTFWHRHWN